VARVAAESKVKENQNNVHPLHPLGAGIKQLPDSDSHRIPSQHKRSQTNDLLGTVLAAPMASAASSLQAPSSFDTSENFVPPQHELSQTNDQLGNIPSTSSLWRGLLGSARSPSQVQKTSENFVEHKPRTPISGVSSSARSSSSNPAVTSLSRICAFMVL
jgi:hypothetical protein